MPFVRAQVIIRTADQLPANFVTNSFAFVMAADQLTADAVTDVIKGFYDDIQPFLSAAVAKNGHAIKFTDILGAAPNYPFSETSFDLDVQPVGTQLPREVSMVTSFQSSRVAGLTQSRRRGRLYIGPLNVTTLSSAGDPQSTFRLGLVNATEALKTAVDALGAPQSVTWVVWSDANQDAVPVLNGWVDSAWDTQRSRGKQSVERFTWGN